MSRRRCILTFAVLIVGLLWSIGYDLRHMPFAVRAWLPYPVNYAQRLSTLAGWPAEPGDGLNCSGFISNAHSSPFRKSYEIYANTFDDMNLLGEAEGVSVVDESKLAIGDVAAFHGPSPARAGVHVAAYLGGGLWIDSDSRRGVVAKFRLSEKTTDPWFAGRVRLYRWKSDPQFSFSRAASSLGKDDRS